VFGGFLLVVFFGFLVFGGGVGGGGLWLGWGAGGVWVFFFFFFFFFVVVFLCFGVCPHDQRSESFFFFFGACLPHKTYLPLGSTASVSPLLGSPFFLGRFSNPSGRCCRA